MSEENKKGAADKVAATPKGHMTCKE